MENEAVKTKENQITEGVIWKQLLLFFFPIVFGMFFQQIYNTADTIIVGRFVGKEALAAVGGSTAQIVNLIVGFFVGLSSGASVVVAQFYGARDAGNLKKTINTALIFSVAAGIVIMAAGICGTGWCLRLMKTPEEIIKPSAAYLYIYFCGMVFNLVYNMGAGILRAMGDSRRPLYVLLITCILNIGLDIIFVVAGQMGVAGAAAATVISQAVSAAVVMYMLRKGQDIYRLRIREIRGDVQSVKSILRIGIPAGLESVMYSISNLVIQVFINELGTDTVAAWGSYGKIDAVFWMVLNAFDMAITTFVGQNFGAGKFSRMRRSVRDCLLMAFGSAVVLIVLLVLFSEQVFGLFTTDESVISIGTYMMHYLMPSYLLYVLIGVLSGALRGAGKVLVPMLFTCGGVCLLRIVWLYGAGAVYPGIETIMLSYPVSWGITSVLFVIYYFRKFPRKREDL